MRVNGQPKPTPRQQEVLEMVAQGQTSPEIGKRLKISFRTVEIHRLALNRLYRVSNIVDLLRAAIAAGHLPKNVLSK